MVPPDEVGTWVLLLLLMGEDVVVWWCEGILLLMPICLYTIGLLYREGGGEEHYTM
jgi:hypothetical protein